jgi:hypothetical protein
MLVALDTVVAWMDGSVFLSFKRGRYFTTLESPYITAISRAGLK